jgi:putative nucleotidyltransferase with HDIG domain
MEKTKFDVIVSDLNMPEIAGIDFLRAAVGLQPGAARIVVSAYMDHLKAAEALNVAHRYFSKPVNIRELGKLLNRLGHFHYLLNNDRVRQMIFKMGALPVLPEVGRKLIQAMDSPYTQMSDISEIVEGDPGLASRLLHTVNSAHFGIARKVVSCGEALQIVGLEALRSLAIGIEIFDFYEDRPFVQKVFQNLWAHSIRTAIGARKIAQFEQQPAELCNVAFISGLLHDIGKLILASNAEWEYRVAMELCEKSRVPLEQAERGSFGCTHAEVGAYLLVLWGFPDQVVEAVENHHRLANVSTFTPPLAIHVAQCLGPLEKKEKEIKLGLLRELGYDSHVTDWQRILSGV